MYYNRTISKSFSALIEDEGELRWLFDFVKNRNDLDFLIGKNTSKEWISVYRGLSRFLTILSTPNSQIIKIGGAKAYNTILPRLYGERNISNRFDTEIEFIINEIEDNPKFDKYYKNKKEGYYQNKLSRKFGICGNFSDEFVIIDKEAVVCYSNQNEKDNEFGKIQPKYKLLQKHLSDIDSTKYGKDIDKKAVGNELDFLAMNRDGDILLIEYKHGTSISGIYLSPIQIGMYYDIFSNLPRNELEKAVFEMLAQKQRIGLINPDWKIPSKIKNIIPVLVISEYNYKSSARKKFNKVLKIARKQIGSDFLSNLKAYNYTEKNGLTNW